MPNSVEGRKQGDWILLDYFDFVVHVFLSERRAFYDIERLRKSARPLTPAEFDEELKAALAARTRSARDRASAKKAAVSKKQVEAKPKSATAKKAAPKKAAAKATSRPAGKNAVAKPKAKPAAKKAAAKAGTRKKS